MNGYEKVSTICNEEVHPVAYGRFESTLFHMMFSSHCKWQIHLPYASLPFAWCSICLPTANDEKYDFFKIGIPQNSKNVNYLEPKARQGASGQKGTSQNQNRKV